MVVKKHMHITEIYNYPLKSSKGSKLEHVEVLPSGIRNDRIVAVVNERGKIVTGRELPQLLNLQSEIVADSLVLQSTNFDDFQFLLPKDGKTIELKLFRNIVYGNEFDSESNDWISDYLEGIYRLVYIQSHLNPILESRGGKEGELKTYAGFLADTSHKSRITSRFKFQVG